MATEEEDVKYYKLGPTASVFHDNTQPEGFATKIVGKQVVALHETEKVADAVTYKHIVPAKAKEVKDYQAEQDKKAAATPAINLGDVQAAASQIVADAETHASTIKQEADAHKIKVELEADKLKKDAEKVRAEADKEAKRIVEDAKKEASRLTGAAKVEAGNIIQEAKNKADAPTA